MIALILMRHQVCGFAQVMFNSGAVEKATHPRLGKIVSRFEGNSTKFRHNMRSLGEFLRSQQGPGFQPFFSVKEKADDPDLNKVRNDTLIRFERELSMS